MTQIKPYPTGPFRTVAEKWRRKMFDTSAIRDELEVLKRDLSGLLTQAEHAIIEGAKSHADPAAEQIKAALEDLGETLEREGTEVEELVAKHPVAAIASALALGVVVGLLLRR